MSDNEDEGIFHECSGQDIFQSEPVSEHYYGMQPVPMPWRGPMDGQALASWQEAGYDHSDAVPGQQHHQFSMDMDQSMTFPMMMWMPEPQPEAAYMHHGAGCGGGGSGGGGYCGFADSGPVPKRGGRVAMQKERFCAAYPNVNRCRHGSRCAFAHDRSEVTAPLLTNEEEMRSAESMTDDFFMHRFKTLWCPIGTQHDWQLCMYAHTYQDVRHPPSIGYGHQLCPYWSKKETTLSYSQRCPLGPRCPYAHGAKEQLYHPGFFRTLVCRDMQRRRCPRRLLCSFFHKKSESRVPDPDNVDYNSPLYKDAFLEDWLQYFLYPPHFADSTDVELAAGVPFWGKRLTARKA